MATVTLDRCWLNQASNPAVSVGFFSDGRSDNRETPGEVRAYANGRLRLVSRTGSRQTLGVTARNLTPAQVAQLDSWRGAVLLFRDVWGRAVYGTFLSVSVVDYRDRSAQDVTFTFQQVSYDPAV